MSCNSLFSLINIMKLRRLGFPKHTIRFYDKIGDSKYSDCNSDKKLNISFNSYTDTAFIHCAAIFTGSKNKINVLSIGENKSYNNSKLRNIHAEMDCIDKLPNRKNKKLMRVNLLVIRLTKSFVLGNSYPCAVCLKYLYDISLKKGYVIDNIYYSNQDGNIESDKFINLIKSPKQIFSAYYRNNNINQEKFMTWIKTI